jgi:hypothetical protein
MGRTRGALMYMVADVPLEHCLWFDWQTANPDKEVAKYPAILAVEFYISQ